MILPASIHATSAQLSRHGVAYSTEIATAAKAQGLDPDLLAAVAAQETGGPGSNAGRNIVGDGGHGHGIFQIDDRWHSFARSASALDPQANADYAARMIRSNLDRYGGDVRKALSAYNAGSPNATGTRTTWQDGTTLGYADSVLRHYRQIAHGDDRATVADVGTLRNAAASAALCQQASMPNVPPPPLSPSPSAPPENPASPQPGATAQSTDYSSAIDPDAA